MKPLAATCRAHGTRSISCIRQGTVKQLQRRKLVEGGLVAMSARPIGLLAVVLKGLNLVRHAAQSRP